jgi:hypothetical protein
MIVVERPDADEWLYRRPAVAVFCVPYEFNQVNVS